MPLYWVEDDTVVQSLIALRLSDNLHTHLGNTAQETWESLENTFGVSYFTMDFHLLQEVMKAKLRVDQNPQVEIQWIWTLLERIRIAGMNLDNYLQAMLLLSAIPQEWDRIASMYCKDMTRQRATFKGVRTAIMAEYVLRTSFLLWHMLTMLFPFAFHLWLDRRLPQGKHAFYICTPYFYLTIYMCSPHG